MRAAMDAVIAYADRFGQDGLSRAVRHGADSYLQALQVFRILHFALWASNVYHNTVGRFDQYMLPYYEKDIAAGILTEESALEATGLGALRHKSVLTLSGGELQRVFLAQVFAQNPQILILDEPANHLDLVYQKHIFSLIQDWLRKPGRAVLSVVHDLSLARRYGTHALLMHEGRCVAHGQADDVLTPDRLRDVYQMDVYGWMREMLACWQA